MTSPTSRNAPPSGRRPAGSGNLRSPRRGAPGRARHAGPRGFTLLEMMLVLALMVIIAALALPALRGPMDDQRLRKSGDLVLAQWSKARVTAMKTGQMQIFRYEIGTDRYSMQAWGQNLDLLEAGAAATTLPLDNQALTADGGLGDDRARVESPLGVSGSRLPPGITFFGGSTVVDARLAYEQSQEGNQTPAQDAAPPIVFYPDGSTTDARLILTNERLFVQLRLRGLTGLGRVSELLAVEELPP